MSLRSTSRPESWRCRRFDNGRLVSAGQQRSQPRHGSTWPVLAAVKGAPSIFELSIATRSHRSGLVLGLRCSCCPGSAPMPKLVGCLLCRRPRAPKLPEPKRKSPSARLPGLFCKRTSGAGGIARVRTKLRRRQPWVPLPTVKIDATADGQGPRAREGAKCPANSLGSRGISARNP
jgi:hypothetical protein